MKRFLRLLALLGLTPILAFAQVNPGVASPSFGGAAATPASVSYTATGASTSLTLQQRLDDINVDIRSFGGVMNSAADQTSKVNAAQTYLASIGGGNIYIPTHLGYFTANIVINHSGIGVYGDGGGALTSSVVGYIKPYNAALPVIQISDDLANYNNCSVRDLHLYTPTGTGVKGLVFAGGAQKCWAFNVSSVGFTSSCLEFRNDDVHPCTFNDVFNFTGLSSVAGCHVMAWIDMSTTGTGWTTACNVTGFKAIDTAGYQVYCEAANGGGQLANGYLECGHDGLGTLVTRPSGRFWAPQLAFSNVQTDSVDGRGTYFVFDLIQGGSDLQVAGQASNLVPVVGQIATGANAYYVAAHTTGTISASSASLSVASATKFVPGRYVLINGAGPSGYPLVSQIVSVSGTTITLANTASTGVTSVDTCTGDLSIPEFQTSKSTVFGANGLVLASSSRNLNSANAPLLFRANNTQSFYPHNGYHWVYDGGPSTDFVWAAHVLPAVSTITQTTTTVTVTTSGNHGLATGDVVVIQGCNETGVNGAFVITYASATTFTYTSGTSQTLAGVTGSPVCSAEKFVSFSTANQGRLDLSINGLGMINNSGVKNKIVAGNPANAQLNYFTPDTTNGFFGFTYGSSITTATAFSLGTAAQNNVQFTGNGAFKLRATTSPSNDATFNQIYSNSTDNRLHIHDVANNDGAILSSYDSAVTVTSAAPTGTASTTAVMMGLGSTATIATKTGGRVFFIISGQMANGTINDGSTVDLRYGTGGAPSNGAAVTGTLVGTAQTTTALVAADKHDFTLQGVVTGLTIGTAYWFDVSLLSVTGGTSTVTNLTATAYEM